MVGIIFVLILTGVLSLGPVVPAEVGPSERISSQVTSSGNDVYGTDRWIVEETRSGRTPKAYVRQQCRVLPISDQEGVEIVFEGQAPNGQYVLQFVTISLLPSGVPSKVHYNYRVEWKDAKTKMIAEPEEKDVIGSICGGIIKELPREVQTLFYGYYGVGERPAKK